MEGAREILELQRTKFTLTWCPNSLTIKTKFFWSFNQKKNEKKELSVIDILIYIF